MRKLQQNLPQIQGRLPESPKRDQDHEEISRVHLHDRKIGELMENPKV